MFYPPHCAARNWLRYYSEHFDTVEVNTTFYRLPRATSVARWVEETPEEFTFAIKVSRYITHIKRLLDVSEHLPLLYERLEPLLGRPSSVHACGSCRRPSRVTSIGSPRRWPYCMTAAGMRSSSAIPRGSARRSTSSCANTASPS